MQRNAEYQNLVSAREWDCLRLVAEGATASEIAWSLGVAVSTVEKHLCAVRKKFGVLRTSQAVAIYWQAQCEKAQLVPTIEVIINEYGTDLSSSRFVDEITQACSFDAAANTLNRHLVNMGFDRYILGLVAEPFGGYTNGARLIGTTFPLVVIKLYERCGGIATDPVPRRIAFCRDTFDIDTSQFMKEIVGTKFKHFLSFGEALMDMQIRRTVIIPSCDEATGAPISLTLAIGPDVEPEFSRNRTFYEKQFRFSLDIFWSVVCRRKLIAPMSELSEKQRLVLGFRASGFRSEQIAERMSVSERSVDKLLSNARKQLGARTTSAAIFRALVLRAI